MASEVDICNSALTKIGATLITSLTQSHKNATACNARYEDLRDDLLRTHTWNFATERVKLAQLSTEPTFGYDYEYQLPSDWIRVVSVHDVDYDRAVVKYKIEGTKLLTNASTIYLRYIKVVTDANEMTADFREALAWRLAAELAFPIANSGTMHDRMMVGFKSALRRARSADAIEDYPENMPESSWTSVRHGSSDDTCET